MGVFDQTGTRIPMGKNFENRRVTVAFYMRSVLILTLTGVKRQFLKSYTILLYNSRKIVMFTPVGRYKVRVATITYFCTVGTVTPVLIIGFG